MREIEKKVYVGSLSFFASIFVLLIIITLIRIFIHDEIDVEYITANFSVPIKFFYPEQSEKLQYIISILSFPVLFWSFYLSLKENIEKFSLNFFKLISLIEILCGILIFIFSYYFSYDARLCYPIKFKTFIIPLLGIFIFTIFLIFNDKNEFSKKVITFFGGFLILFYLYQIFILYNPLTLDFGDATLHHFEAYFYPIYKILSGLTPGIDYRNLYGFYPYVYSLFFNLENITIQKVVMFNCILMTLSVLAVAIVIWTNIKNKIIAYMTFSVSVLLCFLHSFYVDTKSFYYYQYFPHRLFFVVLIIFMISIYLKIGNKKIKTVLEYIGYIISSIAIFWNIESGIAALAGWGAMFFYLSLNKENKLKNISLVLLKIILSFIFAFFLIFIVTYLQSGKVIDPFSLFFGQFIFYKYGFYMLKMNPFKQPFLLVIVPYLIALSASIKNVIDKNINNIDVFKFALAVIGFAVFIYFQGRSHIYCLVYVSYPAFIIIGILMEEYYEKYLKYKKELISYSLAKFICCISYIKFVLLFVVFSIVSTTAFFFIISAPLKFNSYSQEIMQEATQIQKIEMLDKDTEYDILTKDASFYYTALKQADVKPFSHPIDCFLKSDIKKINEYLEKSNKKLVIDEETMKLIDMDYISNIYVIEKEKDDILVLIHRKR